MKPPSNNAAGDAGVLAETTIGDRIDPQHLLLVGAALFVAVTFVALSGLGRSSSDPDPAPTQAATTPDLLAALDDDPAEPEPEVAPEVEPEPTPTTTVETPEAIAMGLPASLLDSEQSQVFRWYRTALGREPDRSGFEFWSDQVRSGTPLEQLANDFLASDE